MCTVTIVSHEQGLTVGCNRDERLDREIALPPVVRRFGQVRAMFPVDARASGTWIGANDAGVAIAVLNRNVAGDRRAAPVFRRSRGAVGLHALGARDLAAAVSRVSHLPLRAFDPFTIVAIHRRELAVITNDGWRYAIAVSGIDRPVLLTSSSLGDALVVGPRAQLFDALLASEPSVMAAQRRFHAHRWPERPHVSVDMRRADAATVSRTWLHLSSSGRVEMRYECTTSSTRSEVELCAS